MAHSGFLIARARSRSPLPSLEDDTWLAASTGTARGLAMHRRALEQGLLEGLRANASARGVLRVATPGGVDESQVPRLAAQQWACGDVGVVVFGGRTPPWCVHPL